MSGCGGTRCVCVSGCGGTSRLWQLMCQNSSIMPCCNSWILHSAQNSPMNICLKSPGQEQSLEIFI